MKTIIQKDTETAAGAGSPFFIHVKKENESGYEAALLGLAHNKKQTPEKMTDVAQRLSDKDGGHNKFLESIYVWLDVRGPRYWWQEADTFRLSTKQSESTMHTLAGELLAIDLEDAASVEAFMRENFEPESCSLDTLKEIYRAAEKKDLVGVKKRLPEGFLQTRMWCMSYRTLRNIILQRRTHRLPHWKEFIRQTLEQLGHPELLPGLSEKE